VRNAFILLVVVALIILALGAANGSIAFDFDVVFGTWTAVSLIWVAAVVAAVVLVVGLLAAWLAQTDASRTRRKLEAELQATYERLRAAEARLLEEPQEASEAPEPQEASEPPGPQGPPEPPSDAPQDEDEASPGVSGEGEVPRAG
jgi:uncharacterized membrane protein YciS (DUF1049 family)